MALVTVMVYSAGLVMKNMRENGMMEKWMGMGLLIFLMESTMKESGKKGHVMAKVHSHHQMEANG